jgi:hypothetical protein
VFKKKEKWCYKYSKRLETHKSEFISLFRECMWSMLDDLIMRHWENAWQLDDKTLRKCLTTQ